MRRLDSYILRQMLAPFGLCIALITTILVTHKVLRLMEMIINKGIPASLFLLFLVFLLPSLLVLSIPMAVLVSILMTFSRMSVDNEIIALKSSGVSLFRMLRPALVFGIVGWLLSLGIMLYVLPYANRPAKEKILEMGAKHADAEIQPRVFFDKFKDYMIYVQEKLPDQREMRGVFVAHTPDDGSMQLMVAARGFLIRDEAHDQTYLRLENGSVHELPRSRGERYTVSSFEMQNLPVLSERTKEKLRDKMPLSSREMTVSELREVIAGNFKQMEATKQAYEEALDKQKENPKEVSEKSLEGLRNTWNWWQRVHSASRVELHKKFSLPFACVIFALIGVPLGIFNRRRKQGGSIGVSLLLFLGYYVLLSAGENLGDDGVLSPFLSMWLPNIVLSVFAAVLLYYSASERIPGVWVRLSDAAFALSKKSGLVFSRLGMKKDLGPKTPGGRKFVGYWAGTGPARFPRLLDRYVTSKFMQIMWIVTSGLIMVFCVVQFVEVIDDAIEHESGVMSAINFVLFSIPQLLFWVIPMAVLVTAMMTVNLMARGNELTVLLAGGTSLRRISVGILMAAIAASALSFALNEYIVPYANREAERIRREDINQRQEKSKFAKYRIWLKGVGKRIYNVAYIDQTPPEPVIKGITIFKFDSNLNIEYILQAESAYFAEGKWYFENVDLRKMTPEGPRSEMMERFVMTLDETPDDFVKLRPEPDEMSYVELSGYIKELKNAGYSYQQYQTDLANKIAMPVIALVIALIAIPLGAMAGKSGKLVGLGAAIGIAGLFFVVHSSFISFGHSGRIPHLLAAWAANILFGTVGLFLYSHARS
ncbi:MAG: LPS export ABC transporter permease LptG [Candidatus Coatesbacteria bacterium]|nr:LPS export ABC transporter permease LptG [Candidatus Coatesbacteria bacterium]